MFENEADLMLRELKRFIHTSYEKEQQDVLRCFNTSLDEVKKFAISWIDFNWQIKSYNSLLEYVLNLAINFQKKVFTLETDYIAAKPYLEKLTIEYLSDQSMSLVLMQSAFILTKLLITVSRINKEPQISKDTIFKEYFKNLSSIKFVAITSEACAEALSALAQINEFNLKALVDYTKDLIQRHEFTVPIVKSTLEREQQSSTWGCQLI